MPTYKGHLVGGAATFVVIHQVTTKIFEYSAPTPKQLFFTLSFCLLGSLFPDIDTKSFGQKLFYALLTIIIFATITARHWEILSIVSLLSVFPLLVNHRGIIHTIWFVTLAPLAVPLIIHYHASHFSQSAWIAYLYFVTGGLSHLLLDYGLWQTIKRLFFRK